jgi:hypothetical protein
LAVESFAETHIETLKSWQAMRSDLDRLALAWGSLKPACGQQFRKRPCKEPRTRVCASRCLRLHSWALVALAFE